MLDNTNISKITIIITVISVCFSPVKNLLQAKKTRVSRAESDTRARCERMMSPPIHVQPGEEKARTQKILSSKGFSMGLLFT